MDKNKIWEREANKKKKNYTKSKRIHTMLDYKKNGQIIFYALKAKILPHNNYPLLSLQSTSIV